MGEQRYEKKMSLWSATSRELNNQLICKGHNRQPGLSPQWIRSSREGLHGGGALEKRTQLG